MIVSYAQNFEDVRLWRALGHIERGFYVDVGAQDPIVDSVSRAFYEKGWRGVHVESSPSFAARLSGDRPDEKVIPALVSDAAGLLTFYEIPGTGLSTADPEIAQQHRSAGYEVRETTLPTVSLATIFDSIGDRDIHWLKVDVEGLEYDVLKSWGASRATPWVLVVESVAPGTRVPSHERWEPLVLKRGYRLACFDGLNRFYVAKAHADLAAPLSIPPNVFDGFSLSGKASSSYTRVLDGQLKELELAAASKDKDRKAREDALLAECENLRQAQIAERSNHQDETARLARDLDWSSRALAEREHSHGEQLADLGRRQVIAQEAASMRLDAYAEQVADLGRRQVVAQEAASMRLDAYAEQVAELSRRQVVAQEAASMRLDAFAGQLDANRQDLQGLASTTRQIESLLAGHLRRVQAEVRVLVELSAQRESRHIAELQYLRDASRKSDGMLRAKIARQGALAAHQANLLRLIFESYSWRLTAPLRAIPRFIQRLLGRGTPPPIELAQPSTALIDEIANTSDSHIPLSQPREALASAIAQAMAIRGVRLKAHGDSPPPWAH